MVNELTTPNDASAIVSVSGGVLESFFFDRDFLDKRFLCCSFSEDSETN